MTHTKCFLILTVVLAFSVKTLGIGIEPSEPKGQDSSSVEKKSESGEEGSPVGSQGSIDNSTADINSSASLENTSQSNESSIDIAAPSSLMAGNSSEGNGDQGETGVSSLAPIVPSLPDDLMDIDQRVRSSSSQVSSTTRLDNVKFEKCDGEQHYMPELMNALKQNGILDEYLENKCKSDYHDNCAEIWKECDSREALTFCPLTCNQTKCHKLRFYGYVDPSRRPTFTKETDDPAENCSDLSNRGDCLSNAKLMSRLCPETCMFTPADKNVLPYMPEEHKLCQFFKHYQNGKFEKFSRYMEYRKRATHMKAVNGSCSFGSVGGEITSSAETNMSSGMSSGEVTGNFDSTLSTQDTSPAIIDGSTSNTNIPIIPDGVNPPSPETSTNISPNTFNSTSPELIGDSRESMNATTPM